jgi:hypothetical protein
MHMLSRMGGQFVFRVRVTPERGRGPQKKTILQNIRVLHGINLNRENENVIYFIVMPPLYMLFRTGGQLGIRVRVTPENDSPKINILVYTRN